MNEVAEFVVDMLADAWNAGARIRASIHLDDAGDLPRSGARLALYLALMDGRCKVPDDVFVELQLDRSEPWVRKPEACKEMLDFRALR
jgi:hypothetical protein